MFYRNKKTQIKKRRLAPSKKNRGSSAFGKDQTCQDPQTKQHSYDNERGVDPYVQPETEQVQ